jgi:hypothetical protein
MTIDEHVLRLSGGRMSLTDEAFQRRLKESFFDIAREQREACAIAVNDIDENLFNKFRAVGAILNATIK